MFPAGHPGYRTTFVELASRERVRVIETGFSRGRPVVFLHGWGCSAWSFNRTLPVIAAAGFRAIALDLRGCGLSDKPAGQAPYETDAMVAHVDETLRILALERPAIVGHSLGGALAMHLALRDPGRCRALALLAPVGFGIARLARLARTLSPPWTTAAYRVALRRWVVAEILGLTYGTLGYYDQRDVDELWAPAQHPGFVPAMRALLHRFQWTPFAWEELLMLHLPALIVRGDRDRVIVQPAESLARYAGAREAVIAGAGHMVHDEAWTEVNPTLVRFLEDAWR
jgi:pimeloyl-ACP methyl ester carboxylesterase